MDGNKTLTDRGKGILEFWLLIRAGRPMPARADFVAADLWPRLGWLTLLRTEPDGSDFVYVVFSSRPSNSVHSEGAGRRIGEWPDFRRGYAFAS